MIFYTGVPVRYTMFGQIFIACHRLESVNDVTFCKSYVTLNRLQGINFSPSYFINVYERRDDNTNLPDLKGREKDW